MDALISQPDIGTVFKRKLFNSLHEKGELFMQHEVYEEMFNISSSNISFDKVFDKPYFPKQYAEEIKKANVLLIPTENIRNSVELSFPELTTEFLQYLRTKEDEGIIPDIAVDDEHYQMLELHSAVITIATCVVKIIILPVFVSVLSAFICEQVKKHNRSEDDMMVDLKIYVDNNGVTKEIRYKGPANKVHAVLNAPVFEEKSDDAL